MGLARGLCCNLTLPRHMSRQHSMLYIWLKDTNLHTALATIVLPGTAGNLVGNAKLKQTRILHAHGLKRHLLWIVNHATRHTWRGDDVATRKVCDPMPRNLPFQSSLLFWKKDARSLVTLSVGSTELEACAQRILLVCTTSRAQKCVKDKVKHNWGIGVLHFTTQTRNTFIK